MITGTANKLLDHTIEILGLKNDAALARTLQVAPPVISKMRHRHLKVGDNMFCRINEATDIDIGLLRMIAGVPSVLTFA